MTARKTEKKDPFTGYPRGWFVIGFTDELPEGGIQKLKYFGQDLVLYRGDDGRARVLGAHCAHLGAHLGEGGKVVGDRIECPFHAWRYDGAGKCVEVPYAKKVPPKACVKGWTVSEQNGLIHVWHHPHDAPPDWELPVIDAWENEEWTRWTPSVLRIQTHPKEIMENVVDRAHFPTVHNTHVKAFENEFRGHLGIQRTTAIAYPQGGGEDLFSITATYHGPGFQISEMTGAMESRLVNAHTPVDETSLDLRFGVMLKKVGSDRKMQTFGKMYSENLRLGFHEDIQIWEHKLYRDTPVLCDGDGPIMKLRKWYAQFYDNPPARGTIGEKPGAAASARPEQPSP